MIKRLDNLIRILKNMNWVARHDGNHSTTATVPDGMGGFQVVRSKTHSSFVRNMLYGGRTYKHPIEYQDE